MVGALFYSKRGSETISLPIPTRMPAQLQSFTPKQ